ncbi:hypothetical protein A3L11_05835 [Thermococcus siculi]|uniref:Lipoprotein n=1 Tax=Thermococcus siculi TaxID=72803 RepID=A0A2Z2MXU5_9EURY|nr:hypothetical protein [Thermococcus siculi]ASJ08770.1 hypothetical protein A3L11_05835 [Thermococcus siculi]
MRRLIALFLIGFVVLASGCIGEQTGLTKEKILTAIENLETASYDQNFSMAMQITNPLTNKTINITMSGRAIGSFNRTAGLESGEMNITTHTMGMDVNVNWPYFVNGTEVYFNVDGRWYSVPSTDGLYEQARGSLNVNYIEKLLQKKNVTIKRLANGYAFRVNVTYWEFVNATNRTGYLNEFIDSFPGNLTVDTNAGWVEVHLADDGTPTFIETHMDITMTFDFSQEKPVTSHVVVHETLSLSDVNEPVKIEVPEGIENAGDFDEVFW